MTELILELIPHAPNLGLYASPYIEKNKLRNALRDYAMSMGEDEVVALYDATLMGSGKDGAVFGKNRMVFQNNDLEIPQEVRYADIVRVDTKRKLIGGKKVLFDVNRGRATIQLVLDFSGKPAAADHVARMLHAVMIRGAEAEAAVRRQSEVTKTDPAAVAEALDDLSRRGLLTDADRARMLDVLG